MGENKSIEVTPDLVDWVGDFLWHWQQSGVLAEDAARVLISQLLPRLNAEQNALRLLPKARALIQEIENRPG